MITKRQTVWLMAKIMTIAVSLTAFISKATQIVCLFLFWYKTITSAVKHTLFGTLFAFTARKILNFAFYGGSKQKTTTGWWFWWVPPMSFFFLFPL